MCRTRWKTCSHFLTCPEPEGDPSRNGAGQTRLLQDVGYPTCPQCVFSGLVKTTWNIHCSGSRLKETTPLGAHTWDLPTHSDSWDSPHRGHTRLLGPGAASQGLQQGRPSGTRRSRCRRRAVPFRARLSQVPVLSAAAPRAGVAGGASQA